MPSLELTKTIAKQNNPLIRYRMEHPAADKLLKVFNHKEMKNTDVDSHAICHSIVEKGYKETIEGIEGSFALCWYDIKKECAGCLDPEGETKNNEKQHPCSMPIR